ncbi:hypothetical protein H1R20_g2900, partial [Candolleomyces eurysporus]
MARTKAAVPSTSSEKARSPSPDPADRPLGPLAVTIPASDREEVKVNNANLTELKNACDDAVKRFLSRPELFKQIYLHTDVRLALGWLSVFVAAGTAFYGYKVDFEKSKPVVTLGLIVYILLTTISTLYAYFIEGDTIFVGKRKTFSKRLTTAIYAQAVLASKPALTMRRVYEKFLKRARAGQHDGNSVISSLHAQSEGGAGADQQREFGTRSRASRATTSRRYERPSVDFVIDIPELVQNVKLEPHEPISQDEILRDGSKKWQSGDPCHYSIPRKGDPWEECFNQVQKFDDEMCRGWREEIDTLLVFAGLFSAAVTAFTVESYRWLRSDPEEATVRLLALISAQLNASANAESPPLGLDPDFPPSLTPSELRVNIFWFTSLTLSLTAVLVGILCKQWLREYQRYEGLTPKEAFPVRQMRYEGLLNWHVPKFLSFLPLLLQSALLIFFAGLLDLLWSLNHLLASVITTLVGIAMILLGFTTVLPFLQHCLHFSRLLGKNPTEELQSQCAFKSPQSRAFHLLGISIVSLYSRLKLWIFNGVTAEHILNSNNIGTSWDSDANWVNYDLEWQKYGQYMERGMGWFGKTYSRNLDSTFHVFHCLESLDEEVAARCVSKIIRDTWNPIIPLVGLLVPSLEMVGRGPQMEVSDKWRWNFMSTANGGTPGAHAMNAHSTLKEKQLARDLVAMSYSLIHSKKDPCFLRRCMEHCVRIANSRDLEENYTSLALEVLSIVVPLKDGPPLPDDMHLQLLATTSSFLQEDKLDIYSSDISSFWGTFDKLRQHEYLGDGEPQGPGKRLAYYDLLKEAEQWLSRLIDCPDTPLDDKARAIRDFSNGLCSIYWTIRADSEIDDMKSSSDYEPFYAFISFIDELLVKFGGASLVMSPWNSEVWDLIKVEFGPNTDSIEEEEKE